MVHISFFFMYVCMEKRPGTGCVCILNYFMLSPTYLVSLRSAVPTSRCIFTLFTGTFTIHTYACMHTHAHSRTHAHSHTHTHTIYTYAHVHTHTTHTFLTTLKCPPSHALPSRSFLHMTSISQTTSAQTSLPGPPPGTQPS